MSKARLHWAMAAEPALGQHLGSVFRSEQMVQRYPDLVVDDVVVVPRLRLDLDARRLPGHHEHAVGAHDEEDVGHPTGAGEPFLTVDHPLVAITGGEGPEEIGVGSALGLGHRIGGPQLLSQHRLQPPFLLVLSAVGGQHLHIAGIGCGRPEHLWCRGVPAQDLVEQSELELAVARSAEVLVEEDGPQALVLHLLLETPHQLADLRVL
jgi:hypothetical protein